MTQASLYDAEYLRTMRRADGGDVSLHETFLRLLGGLPLPTMRVLDVGCGRGELMALVATAGAPEVSGLDFSPDAVEWARRHVATHASGTTRNGVVLGSATDPNVFPAARFELALMTDVVEHLPPADLAVALANVRRWLTPGGRLLIHTFPTAGPHRLFRAWLHAVGDHALLARLDAIHCNVQTRRTLRLAVAAAGLACDRMWLQNDFFAASTAFQAMPDGARKRFVRRVVGAVQHRAVRGLLGALGLAEFASPSIYCWCSVAESGQHAVAARRW